MKSCCVRLPFVYFFKMNIIFFVWKFSLQTHNTFPQCTQFTYPASHNHSQHNQCRTPYAVIHGLVLLMMGIMMPETCWDRSLIINIGLVASCWFISLNPTHDTFKRNWKAPENSTLEGTGLINDDVDHHHKFCLSVLLFSSFFFAPLRNLKTVADCCGC